MKERRLAEVNLLRAKYGKITHDEECSYVIIHDFPVHPGWNMRTVDVLILIPPGYPNSPPDNVYVTPGLRLANGAMPGAFNLGQTQIGRQWDSFSWHIDGAWAPAADMHDGSNLLDYARGFEERLSQVS